MESVKHGCFDPVPELFDLRTFLNGDKDCLPENWLSVRLSDFVVGCLELGVHTPFDLYDDTIDIEYESSVPERPVNRKVHLSQFNLVFDRDGQVRARGWCEGYHFVFGKRGFVTAGKNALCGGTSSDDGNSVDRLCVIDSSLELASLHREPGYKKWEEGVLLGGDCDNGLDKESLDLNLTVSRGTIEEITLTGQRTTISIDPGVLT